MMDIKLTRWTTYLLPGSLVVFSVWVLSEELFLQPIVTPLALPSPPYSSALTTLAFLGLSYVVGMGLWGVGYHEYVQRVLFGHPHLIRIKHMRNIISSSWYKEKKLPEAAKLFPKLVDSTACVAEAYHEFEFAIVQSYLTKSTEMKERIVRERETIGLLQALILALLFSGLCSVVLGTSKLLQSASREWPSAISYLTVSLMALIIVVMLYVHYFRRQHYLVRDVLMILLSDKEIET